MKIHNLSNMPAFRGKLLVRGGRCAEPVEIDTDNIEKILKHKRHDGTLIITKDNIVYNVPKKYASYAQIRDGYNFIKDSQYGTYIVIR